MASQVQVIVLNALETVGFKQQPMIGPPGSPQPTKVTPDTVAYINSVEGSTFYVDAEGNVTPS